MFSILFLDNPQKTRDRFFRDKRSHRARDVEGRKQAKKYVRGKIGCEVAKPAVQ